MAAELIPVARDSLIVPLDTARVAAEMARYQEGLKSILDDSDYQGFVDRKTGETKQFPKKSAWRKIAYWFNLDLELISEEIDRDDRGDPVRARVKARATHPNGRRADGDGGCSIREPRVFGKPEHDIPGTAATRAMNRAISNLVGMGEVSAEEIEGEQAPAHEYGPAASAREVDGLERAVGVLYDAELGDLPNLQVLFDRLEQDAGGYLPKIVTRALMLTAAHRRPQPPRVAEQEEAAAADVTAEGTPAEDEPNAES